MEFFLTVMVHVKVHKGLMIVFECSLTCLCVPPGVRVPQVEDHGPNLSTSLAMLSLNLF
jgi:hypothetical protein